MFKVDDNNLALRLIGLYLHPMDSSVCNNLRGGWYPFGHYEEPQNGYVNVPPVSEIEANIYRRNNAPRVTVSCIVGKNGSGKSTLLEIMYKIVNNLACRLTDSKAIPMSTNLAYANGIRAELYYQCDGKLNRIVCMDQVVTVFRENNYGIMAKVDVNERKFDEILRQFFYTIAVNYSIYSFNEDDNATIKGKLKQNSWVEGLFHKNDGYMTPITLVPYRNHGIIDVNRENFLAHQRILTFSLLFFAKRKQFPYGYRPKVVSFKINESYRENTWNKFLNNHKNWNAEILKDFRVEIEDVWEDFVSKDLAVTFGTGTKMYNLVLFYLSYKSLKICLTYSDYYDLVGADLLRGIEQDQDADSFEKLGAYMPAIAKRVVAKIQNEPVNHLTLKIHQCLEYIRRHDSILEGSIDAYTFIERHPVKTYDDVFLFLMYPSFFDMDIEYVRVNKRTVVISNYYSDGNTSFSLSKMSSGEKQMMNMISYVIYHLKNVQSVDADNYRIPYHHVNLVFDEAELYYHPEYQRRFISMLLESLTTAGIDRRKIRSVNLLVATHSPFILSDVLTENTLYLSDGLPKKVERQTFGSNYYDMLRSSFFFTDSPIGDVASKSIKRWIQGAKRRGKSPSDEILRLVGDSFIAQYLRNMDEDVQD